MKKRKHGQNNVTFTKSSEYTAKYGVDKSIEIILFLSILELILPKEMCNLSLEYLLDNDAVNSNNQLLRIH